MTGDWNRILIGDVRDRLGDIADNSIDCIVTSPPYFRLRNYGAADQIGLEDTVDSWVDELRLVAQGLHRVLKPTGGFWLNLGDTFARHPREGAAPKSLLLAPERLAVALVADGWILRNKIIWAKPNPMPTSVKDRLSCTWEQIYFFTKHPRYTFNLDAIRIPHKGQPRPPRTTANRPTSRRTKTVHPDRRRVAWSVPTEWRGPSSGTNSGLDRLKASGLPGHPLGKNPGDVWTIPTAGYRGAHHAVYPIALAERPILASSPQGGSVLDPFIGSGTTAIAAEKHRRRWIGIELNPNLAALAEQRIRQARNSTSRDLADAA